MSAFVAVLLSPPVESVDLPVARPSHPVSGLRAELAAAGAVAVLDWAELAEPDPEAGPAWYPDDDLPAVLLEPDQDPADLRRVLDALEADDRGPAGSLRGAGDTVIATTRPVTDTLKLVARDGELTGTADRERHRFVDLPIAAPLGLLRKAAERLGSEQAAEAAAEAADAAGGLARSLGEPDGEARVGPVEVLGALAGTGAAVLSCPAASSHRSSAADHR